MALRKEAGRDGNPASRRLPVQSSSGPHLSRRTQPWQFDAMPEGQGPSSLPLLGEGAYGQVYRGKFGGLAAAVKEVTNQDDDLKKELRGQKFLLGLRHENIVRYLYFDTSRPEQLFVVMELVIGRNLVQLQTAGALSERQVPLVIEQTCRGLDYLHSHKPPIVHRDVKGANIMLTEKEGQVKLIDLGLAILCDNSECDYKDSVNRWSLAGTPQFIAPEVYKHHAYSSKSDVYALGCTLYQLLCGEPPHADKSNEMAVCYAVIYGSMPEIRESSGSRLAIDLYNKCTKRDPAERPTAAEIIQHGFILKGS